MILMTLAFPIMRIVLYCKCYLCTQNETIEIFSNYADNVVNIEGTHDEIMILGDWLFQLCKFSCEIMCKNSS